jgi:hypothetical protein
MANQFQAGEPGSADAYAETVRIRVLPESVLQQGACSEPPVRSFDPYNTDIGTATVDREPRKNLDDMRRLSETIMRLRRRTKGAA